MIDKPTTSEIMDKFIKATEDVTGIKDSINSAKTAIEKKLAILNAEIEYQMNSMNELKEIQTNNTDKILLATAAKTDGLYEGFGITLHPALIKKPKDLFNFYTSTGYIFKNNMTVTVNGKEDAEFKNVLIHDSISTKDYFIKEYDTDELDIIISVDQKNTLGDLNFNVIELQPFMPCSFNIIKLDVYEFGNNKYAVHGLDNILKVGAQRIILDEKVSLNKIEFKIKLLYKNANGKYPFGLKHLYLLNANFKDNCYVVIPVTEPKNIRSISDTLSIKNQFGVQSEASATEKQIQFFSSYANGVLSHEIETSTDATPNIISINIKTIYIRIPIKTSIISVIPQIELIA